MVESPPEGRVDLVVGAVLAGTEAAVEAVVAVAEKEAVIETVAVVGSEGGFVVEIVVVEGLAAAAEIASFGEFHSEA